ncbi:MAG: hypothetical protein IAB19_07445 [Proteobacteria bacterium]|uniref:ISAzo13 family transposase n=1 Tax=Candidatus Avisuccinivibrio stercorigallinarum TaxID=2840704 RepID=A0A9D9DAP3_9GAMM|nr:hypothetical protein [Candidatus Avisuccinivibrio stercorigallinarum]
MSDTTQDLVLKDLTPLIKFINSELDERRRRMALGALVLCFKHGASKQIGALSGASNTTLTQGKKEALALLDGQKNGDQGTDDAGGKRRIRAAGAGRKKSTALISNLESAIKEIIEGAAGGNDGPLSWSVKSLRSIQQILERDYHIKVSHTVIGEILKDAGYVLQQNKRTAGSIAADEREAQFKFLSSRCQVFLQNQLPVAAIELRKKVAVQPERHDGRAASGSGSPNEFFVPAAISDDSAEFAVCSLNQWWSRMGQERYPEAGSILVAADCADSRGNINLRFKHLLQDFADQSGLKVHFCLFPAGTAKWQRIEQRMSFQLSLSWPERAPEIYEIVVSLIGSSASEVAQGGQKAAGTAKVKSDAQRAAQTVFNPPDGSAKSLMAQWNCCLKPRAAGVQQQAQCFSGMEP